MKVKAYTMSPKRALMWVLVWITSAILFSLIVFHFRGSEDGIEFLTCYAIEWSLSVDNLFVFLMIFTAFGVIPRNQVRALRWGIIGAIVMRLGFILIGVTLVEAFRPVLYFFGALLIFSAVRMVYSGEGEKDISKNKLVNFVRKRIPVTKRYYGKKFFIHRRGALIATPMVLVLVTIESSDIMFAIDSIPAAFAITRDPIIIFTANFFAILGLRSLYFLLAHAEKTFGMLRYGVAIILAFVGVKIILEQLHIPISMYISLGVVILCLAGSIIISTLVKNSARSNASRDS